MTPATRPLTVPDERGAAASEVRGAPVVVLALPFGGGIGLGSLLSRHPDLACTSGTGVLPLCEQAMATWRNVDGRGGRPSSRLALAATRALATSIITSVLAREGKRRWCEVAAPNTLAAETFLSLYPGTRFLCLHRALPDVIRAALDASPWGIAHPAFAPYTMAFPASTAAALTAYWVEHTGNLLAFEQAHPQECLGVRFEDLTESSANITSFLGLGNPDGYTAIPVDAQQQGQRGLPANVNLLVDLIPPNLLSQANDLFQQLGYPPTS